MNQKNDTKYQFIKSLIVAVSIGILLGFTGAFESQSLPILVRMAYFILVSLVGTIIARTLAWGLDKLIDPDDRPILFNTTFLVLMSLPICLAVMALNTAFFGHRFNFTTLFRFLPIVSGISAFFLFVHLAIDKVPMQTHVQQQTPSLRPKLYDKLPIKYRNASILAVKAEDHYLRIFTSIGEELILYRLKDAILDLDGIEGVQTHRSWWVALDAIEIAQKNYGKAKFILTNKIEAPISRSYSKALMELKLL